VQTCVSWPVVNRPAQLRCRAECSTWAGMLVTQYGRISSPRAKPRDNVFGSGAVTPPSAIDHLREYYGLSAPSSPSQRQSGQRAQAGFGRCGEVTGQDEGVVRLANSPVHLLQPAVC
jgi:hypothetical protein